MTQSPKIEFDARATRRRLERLERCMSRNVLHPPRFLCPHFRECKASIQRDHRFFEGLLSHVGKRYDLTRNGKPLRIMVVGQEYGLGSTHGHLKERKVTLQERYEMIHDGSGLNRRYYSEPGHPPRNPHMRGTTSALRVLFGRGLGSDWEGECIEPVTGRPFHIFDGFALVNVLLCSAGPNDLSEGRSTPTMHRNCLGHFAETVKILKPTIIVLQGQGVALWTARVLDARRIFCPTLVQADGPGGRVLVCRFSHPSARGELRWGDRLASPYLVGVVEPTLKLALRKL